MRLEQDASPHKVEMTLLKFIIPDAAFMFFLVWVISSAAMFYMNILELRLFIFAVAGLGLFSLVLTALRFYSYWTTIVRVMGSLEHFYEEFGDGKCKVVAEFPQPFILFGFLVLRKAKKSPAKHYSFSVKTDSQKYKLTLDCLVKKGKYDLNIKVIDWHNISHTRELKGNVTFLQRVIPKASQAIRQEVLESRGIQVKKPKAPPAPSVAMPVPKPPALPVPPKISPKRKPKPLSPPPKIIAKKPVPTTVKAVEKQRIQVEEKLVDSSKKKEQDALQDALFELEELERMLKA